MSLCTFLKTNVCVCSLHIDVCQYVNVTESALVDVSSKDCSKRECVWCVNPTSTSGVTMLHFEMFTIDAQKQDRLSVGYGYNFSQENTLVFLNTSQYPSTVAVENTRLWIRMSFQDDLSSGTSFDIQLGWVNTLCECVRK